MNLNTSVLCLLLFTRFSVSYDVLMVIGGYYTNTSLRQNVIHNSVEVIGPNGVCEISSLPEPRHSLTATTVGKSVFACGGFYIYERKECFEYIAKDGIWKTVTSLPNPTVFLNSVEYNKSRIIIGGRTYSFEKDDWDYSKDVKMILNESQKWIPLPSLSFPLADSCSLLYEDLLILISGSNGYYRYAYDPSQVFSLQLNDLNADWRTDIIPSLLEARLWPACAVSTLNFGAYNRFGLVVTGGYYNGARTMFLDLMSKPLKWEWLDSLPEPRKWSPSLGIVNNVLTIAGGGDYGDDTMDEFLNGGWTRSFKKMKYKREFSASVTVPHSLFPTCSF